MSLKQSKNEETTPNGIDDVNLDFGLQHTQGGGETFTE